VREVALKFADAHSFMSRTNERLKAEAES